LETAPVGRGFNIEPRTAPTINAATASTADRARMIASWTEFNRLKRVRNDTRKMYYRRASCVAEAGAA
jgi:hypothetical protein